MNFNEKIMKINELKEMLVAGTIDQSEFEILKKEIVEGAQAPIDTGSEIDLHPNTTDQELLEYIQQVYMVEKEKYIAEEMIKALEDQIPVREVICKEKYPQEPTYKLNRDELRHVEKIGFFRGIGYLSSALTLVSFLIALLAQDYSAPNLFLAFLLSVAFTAITSQIKKEGDKKYYESAQNRYRNERREYESRIKEIDQNYKNQIREQEKYIRFTSDSINTEISTVMDVKRYLDSALDKLYSFNVIHPKYRNLIAISQIYDYLDTERCFTLKGNEGAYQLFENDCKANLIIQTLSKISNKLDSIVTSQKLLYYAVQEMQSTVSDTIESVNVGIRTGFNNLQNQISSISDYEMESAKALKEIADSSKINEYRLKGIEQYTRSIKKIQEWDARRTWYGNDEVLSPTYIE